ncbi:MAG: cobalt-precorrin-5B (C(1))-methyltransferase [Deltaproteobacteria bacterium]|nr:cobalt-precorrin-5B (C(1))-methyltransferase [Deltaproteobacteria bacterium]
MTAGKNTPESTSLRSGFSTGAYAAATTVAAWRCLQGLPFKEKLRLLFADGTTRPINLDGVVLHPDKSAEAWAAKDGGDDIDATDGAIIRTRLSRLGNSQPREEDFQESCGQATLIIRGGAGVGLVSRTGLDVPVGKWAINPVPRHMIVENLRHNGAGSDTIRLLAEIAIDNGEKLARQTLNPVLGIEGGLSILGTTGLVIPCSHAAYVATIRVLVRGAAASNVKKVALVTGGKTHRQIRNMLPDIPEYACVRIGDFIREALEICRQEGISKVFIGCMAGKLAKYALGHANTHAHRVSQDVGKILDFLKHQGFPEAEKSKTKELRSFREFMESLPQTQQQQIVAFLTKAAVDVFREWAPGLEVELLVFNPLGKLLSERDTP